MEFILKLVPAIIIAVIVIVLLLVGYVKAPPDQAYIISGLKKEGKILIGRAGIRIPFFERLDKLYLGQMTVDIKTEQSVPTNDFINVNVDAVAKVRIAPTQEGIKLAAKNFLNKKAADITMDLQDSLQGNMREIIGTLSLKEINTDRDSFSDQVMQKASKDMDMECSSDPMLSALQEQLTGVKLGENGSARALIRASNVRALCTTDDPADDLQYHRLLAADTSFDVRVLPTFRPEKALNIADPGYPAYLKKLGEAAGIFIHTIDDVKQALALRAEFFAQVGCRLSDHSFGSPDFTVWDEDAAGKAVIRALNGETLTGHEVSAYQSLMMDFLGELYCDKGFGMQLHLGAQRNLSGRLYRSLGADVGGDAIGDTISAGSLAALLDRLAARDKLPKTILYTLNAADNDKLIAAAGCFQDESAPGKVQFGSAWWFNDHFDGMTAQMKSLANIGVLSRFIGMLTDSRSFLSYPRHEYFRRVLCELVGSWIEKGMAPADYDAIGGMIEDICFNNAWSYMGM